MKKTLLSAALFAACVAASAQKITYVPYTDNPILTGTTISENGRYLAGPDIEGRVFIYDTETGKLKMFQSPSLDDENAGIEAWADIRSVTNDGVGYGDVDAKSAKFDFATGKYNYLLDESVEDNSLVHYATADGKFNCGVTYNDAYIQHPYVMKDGKMSYLPELTDEWTGYETNGFIANGANKDGSVIFGSVIDNFASYPLVVWTLNRDGQTYSISQLSKRFFDGSLDLDGVQPYDIFTGSAISSNGKWIAVSYHKKMVDADSEDANLIGRYNVETDVFDTLTCPNASADLAYFATSVADDGTILGMAQEGMSSRNAVICKAGETEFKNLSAVYPTITDFSAMETNGFLQANSITPDGRYIVGYGYKDYDDENYCYATWCLDTQTEATGVEGVADASKQSKVVASYTVDGKKLNRPTMRNELVINRFANGKVKKMVK